MTVIEGLPEDKPNPDAIGLGNDHWFSKVYHGMGNWTGIHEYHKDSEGKWCVGWVPFSGWTVVNYMPLTLEPSLQCKACNSHGWIRDGKWVEA